MLISVCLKRRDMEVKPQNMGVKPSWTWLSLWVLNNHRVQTVGLAIIFVEQFNITVQALDWSDHNGNISFLYGLWLKGDIDKGEYVRDLDGVMKRHETTTDPRKDRKSTNADSRAPADIYGEPTGCKAQRYTTEIERRRKPLPAKKIRGRKHLCTCKFTLIYANVYKVTPRVSLQNGSLRIHLWGVEDMA